MMKKDGLHHNAFMFHNILPPNIQYSTVTIKYSTPGYVEAVTKPGVEVWLQLVSAFNSNRNSIGSYIIIVSLLFLGLLLVLFLLSLLLLPHYYYHIDIILLLSFYCLSYYYMRPMQ